MKIYYCFQAGLAFHTHVIRYTLTLLHEYTLGVLGGTLDADRRLNQNSGILG